MPLSAELLRWPDPPMSVALSTSGIHVWLIHLDCSAGAIEPLALHLNADERRRADRFVTSTLKNRFMVGRSALREIVSAYVGCSPEELPIGYGLHGKPEIVGSSLQFNLAHSEGLALIAVSGQTRVGIDLECERHMSDVEQLARQYFSDSEYKQLVSRSPEERSRYFLEGWTLREAYLKATGEGLFGLEKLRELVFAPNCLVPGWFCYPLVPLQGFIAMLVAQGEDWRPQCWQWERGMEGRIQK